MTNNHPLKLSSLLNTCNQLAGYTQFTLFQDKFEKMVQLSNAVIRPGIKHRFRTKPGNRMPKTHKSKDLIELEPMQRLLTIMARLRDPDGGCPWDLQQTFDTIAPYTIEEAYEVADAIKNGRMVDLRDELGDLLLQVVFHAQIAKEQR